MAPRRRAGPLLSLLRLRGRDRPFFRAGHGRGGGDPPQEALGKASPETFYGERARPRPRGSPGRVGAPPPRAPPPGRRVRALSERTSPHPSPLPHRIAGGGGPAGRELPGGHVRPPPPGPPRPRSPPPGRQAGRPHSLEPAATPRQPFLRAGHGRGSGEPRYGTLGKALLETFSGERARPWPRGPPGRGRAPPPRTAPSRGAAHGFSEAGAAPPGGRPRRISPGPGSAGRPSPVDHVRPPPPGPPCPRRPPAGPEPAGCHKTRAKTRGGLRPARNPGFRQTGNAPQTNRTGWTGGLTFYKSFFRA